MQSNITEVYDDLNDYPDSWVELYNAGMHTENLSDYSIGIKESASKAYQLPDKIVEPGSHILVFCDKADNGLHTDFRLDSGKGGAIYLFNNGEIADKIEEIAKQPCPNIAYGRVTDGAADWGYQLIPTPAATNCGETVSNKKILPEPEYSIPGCIVSESMQVTLGIPADAPEGTVIRYSLDCSDVTPEHPVYDGQPIAIDKTTIIRARLFCQGYISPLSTTHSYITHYQELSLPLVSIVTDEQQLYGDRGILMKPFCYQDYCRPINFEYFEPSTSESAILNQLCETRTGGGWTSRNRPQKTLMVYANKRFGTKRLTHEFFPEQKPGLNDFKSIMLRNAGNDYDHLFLRDAAVQRAIGMNLKNIDWQADQLCVLYINGIYSGLRHIRERSNEDNIYTNYNGLEDIDMVENWEELKEGDIDAFNELKAFYSTDPTDAMADEYRQRVDVEEFLSAYIVNLYYLNIDWPGNNFVLWRPQTDGKWRALLKDMDWIMGFNNTSPESPQLKTLIDASIPQENPSELNLNMQRCMNLFRRMLMINDFREMFIDQTMVYMADFLRPEVTIDQMNMLRDDIMPEWSRHAEVAEIDESIDKYDEEFGNVVDWLNRRWNYFYNHITDYFSLGEPNPFKLTLPEDIYCRYTINGVDIENKSLNGRWPTGRTINIKSDSPAITGWSVTITSETDGTTTEQFQDNEFSFVMPNACGIEITPLTNSSAIDEINTDHNQNGECEYFDIMGRAISNSNINPGVYIRRNGNEISKIIMR